MLSWCNCLLYLEVFYCTKFCDIIKLVYCVSNLNFDVLSAILIKAIEPTVCTDDTVLI
jgi:hypothetical protein